jgi:hypothetical protein
MNKILLLRFIQELCVFASICIGVGYTWNYALGAAAAIAVIHLKRNEP